MVVVVTRRVWEGLTRKERREVLRLARHSQSHPDPDVARAAMEWSDATLEPRAWVPDGIISIALGLVDSGVGGGWLGGMLSDRRMAKRIRNLNEKHPTGSDE
jgi:hypothetical protein